MHLVCNLYHKQGLLDIFDRLVIDVREVLRQVDRPAIVLERVGQRIQREVDLLDKVGPVVTPVSDDGLAVELKSRDLFCLMLAVRLLFDLAKSVETGLC